MKNSRAERRDYSLLLDLRMQIEKVHYVVEPKGKAKPEGEKKNEEEI